MLIVSIFLYALWAEPKDKHPRTTPKELQFSGGCFRRDKNEKSQCANNSANNGDNLWFHNLKIIGLKIYGCRTTSVPSQNWNAYDTTVRTECDYICPQIQNTYRARKHLSECRWRSCLMRIFPTCFPCRWWFLGKCLFSSLWKFIVKLVVCAAKVHIKIEYPNKILLFIENLCFCSLKIGGCIPKIPIGRKNKNFGCI